MPEPSEHRPGRPQRLDYAVVAHAARWFAPVIVPVLVWIGFRRTGGFVRAHAATAFNFQASRVAGLLAVSYVNTRDAAPEVLVAITFVLALAIVASILVQGVGLLLSAVRGEAAAVPALTPTILG